MSNENKKTKEWILEHTPEIIVNYQIKIKEFPGAGFDFVIYKNNIPLNINPEEAIKLKYYLTMIEKVI